MQHKFSYRLVHNYTANSYRFAWFVSLLILAGLLAYRLLLIFSYNGEVGGIDNNFVYDVVRGIGGQPIYTNPAEAPFAITLYSPLYYTICIFTGKLLNMDTSDPIHIYQLCRTVSLACDILTCILLYYSLRKRFGVTKPVTLFAVACFACIICALGYTFSRCDSLLLTFYSATLFVLTNRSSNNKHLHVLTLALLSVLCILAKQNGIVVPALVISWLVLHREKKSVLYYLLFFAAFSTVFLFYSMSYSYFFENTVMALRNRIDLSWFYRDIFKRMMNSLWVLPLYIAALLSVKQWTNQTSRDDKGLAAIFIIQTLFSLVASLKWGSTAGYFNESFLLSFLLIGRAANATLPATLPFSRKVMAALLPLVFLFFLHTLAEGYLFFIQNQPAKKMAYLQQKQVRDYLQPKLDGRSVLNLANANADFFKTLFYKNIAVPNMDMVDCCTLPDRTFDYSLLKEQISNGGIAYILTYGDAAPAQLWGMSLQDFQKDTTLNGYVIYRYR